VGHDAEEECAFAAVAREPVGVSEEVSDAEQVSFAEPPSAHRGGSQIVEAACLDSRGRCLSAAVREALSLAAVLLAAAVAAPLVASALQVLVHPSFRDW